MVSTSLLLNCVYYACYSDVKRVTRSELGYFKVETPSKKSWYIHQDKLAALWPDVVEKTIADGIWESDEEVHNYNVEVDIASLKAKIVINEIATQESITVYEVKPSEENIGSQYYLDGELNAHNLVLATKFQKKQVFKSKKFIVELFNEPRSISKKNLPKGCRPGMCYISFSALV